MTNQPTPPMPAVIRDEVEMGLNKIPVQHRSDMRYLIRRTSATVWEEGYWQAHREARNDAADHDRTARMTAEAPR